MSEPRDVVIVGAGLMGAATAWAAARRGLDTEIVEQHAAGHRLGSSHGSARIVRRAYADVLYTQLTGRAFELWSELQDESGAVLLRMVGGLDFGANRQAGTIARHLAAAGVEHELLDAAEAQRRWPGMRFAGPVVYHAQAGVLDADAALSTLLAQACAMGAVVRHDTAATSIELRDGGAEVALSDGSRIAARRVVVAAGGWVGPLLEGVVQLPPLRVTQQQIVHFPRRNPAEPPWPSVIHDDVERMYHLAGGRDGGPGDDRKIGEHDRGTLTRAADADGVVDPSSVARVIDYVKRWLPGLEPTPSSSATCIYTSTPSEDFILDQVGPVIVCSPCSGHGAKFAPLIGELAIGLVTGDSAVPDRFRLSTHARGISGSVSL